MPMFFNASLFLRLGLKFIGNLECDILTVRMFYSRAGIKIIKWDHYYDNKDRAENI